MSSEDCHSSLKLASVAPLPLLAIGLRHLASRQPPPATRHSLPTRQSVAVECIHSDHQRLSTVPHSGQVEAPIMYVSHTSREVS